MKKITHLYLRIFWQPGCLLGKVQNRKFEAPCPDGFPLGVVKIFAFPRSKSGIFDLALNPANGGKYFSKVSPPNGRGVRALLQFKISIRTVG